MYSSNLPCRPQNLNFSFLCLQSKAVEIVAQQMVTDLPSSFEHSFLDLAGVAMARKAAVDCYRSSGLTPYDVNVIEVHDCFSCNEVSLDSFCLVHI